MNTKPTAQKPTRAPLTAAQQAQVVAYCKIARDLSRRLARGYERLVPAEEAESVGLLALCEAAQRFDPSRAGSVWPLAKLRIAQRVHKSIRTAMAHSAALGGEAPDDVTAPSASADDRRALRVIVGWVGDDVARAETIDRAASGAPLTTADAARLEELREELGMLPGDVVAVDVATASRKLGRSPKVLRSALARGRLPGVRCGATWRVYLSAALRAA